MTEQVVIEEGTQEEKVDGRTTEGKILARLQKLEDDQEKYHVLLFKQIRRIDECSIRR